jgi:hypothetical protein
VWEVLPYAFALGVAFAIRPSEDKVRSIVAEQVREAKKDFDKSIQAIRDDLTIIKNHLLNK